MTVQCYPSVRKGIKAKESNRLPAQNGPTYLVMRLYWHNETPFSIRPTGEDTWKPPAIVVSKYSRVDVPSVAVRLSCDF